MASAVGGGGVSCAMHSIPGDSLVPSDSPAHVGPGCTGLKRDKICSTLARIKGSLWGHPWGPGSGFPLLRLYLLSWEKTKKQKKTNQNKTKNKPCVEQTKTSSNLGALSPGVLLNSTQYYCSEAAPVDRDHGRGTSLRPQYLP